MEELCAAKCIYRINETLIVCVFTLQTRHLNNTSDSAVACVSPYLEPVYFVIRPQHGECLLRRRIPRHTHTPERENAGICPELFAIKKLTRLFGYKVNGLEAVSGGVFPVLHYCARVCPVEVKLSNCYG